MSQESVVTSRSAGIASITLNRPAQGNAINLQLARELEAAARECDSDASIRCVVISGAGRLFCAGGDLSVFKDAGTEVAGVLTELAGTIHSAISHLAHMQKPLLCLVNGPAAGAGLSLALLGDVVLAAQSSHFTCAYTGIGLTPDGGMTWLLPRLIGMRRAQDMLVTNRRIGAGEAERIGLVTRVVNDEALAEEGANLALSLAQSATLALGATRSLIFQSFDSSLDSQLARESGAIATAGGRFESHEGISAFIAKRSPNFKGA